MDRGSTHIGRIKALRTRHHEAHKRVRVRYHYRIINARLGAFQSPRLQEIGSLNSFTSFCYLFLNKRKRESESRSLIRCAPKSNRTVMSECHMLSD